MHSIGVRHRIQAASRQIRRLKRIDRAASGLIVAGGIGVVASVLGILLVVGGESAPLFEPVEVSRAKAIPLGPEIGEAAEAGLPVGTDEYLQYAFVVVPSGEVRFLHLDDGAAAESFSVNAIAGARVTTAALIPSSELVAVGTEDGRVALVRVELGAEYRADAPPIVHPGLEEEEALTLDPEGRSIEAITVGEDRDDEVQIVAGIVAGDILLWRSSEAPETALETLSASAGERFTCVAASGVSRIVAGTDSGHVYHWNIEDGAPSQLTDISPVGSSPITSLAWIIGGETFVVGNANGETSSWFRARANEADEAQAMMRTRVFPRLDSPIVALTPSTRDRSFLALAEDGAVAYRFVTSERELVRSATLSQGRAIGAVAPRNDALLVVRADGSLTRFGVAAPHPEVSLKTLFGKVWYEGYAAAEYVWQSTGATNVFEPKLSLIPLIFGTIKGTLYALIFAVPIAVMGALYTSQFVHPAIRAKIKPVVEIMAALPSVVVGFLAGLWLAPLIERHVVAVFLMFVLVPMAGTLGVVAWSLMPARVRRALKPGMEVLLILPLLVAGMWLSLQVGPTVEAAVFSGDFKLWLSTTLGLTYDQRNCLVVGLALGFAVIPIIFTISEDAFSAVPSSLTAASLALGSSRWQTALRVVLPTASPGVFSAIMVGFGRAVGETMIVLMATGNTPVLDWSIFNGMRTLSANIAVEVPEAPYGGTLYRVLFLSGALLFVMTFIVNTVAEIVRQRLRERYRAL